ncbi:hypothetical protein KDA_51470 [Dictyobacter alpinus]|uniref:Alpha-galactosidase n=1 Tax=Dictyobacter alpinus TaxID=2014873 RepID=A0A402BE47_9CHLR|nr:alpha-galactosidase [Dictyobacter alpinus]GCE29663.1 hypothetical protein KDA_51470 [Dictyobacter alpinus]
MMQYLDIKRSPDSVRAQFDDGWMELHQRNAGNWQLRELALFVGEATYEQQVIVRESQRPLKRLVLRWQQRVAPELVYLSDEWERGYGELGWRNLVPERILPWYFLTYDGSLVHGYGVKTGAAAFCFWQVDSSGVSLWLDVRNGSAGVELGTRELLVAEIVSRLGNEGEGLFAAAQQFCRQMCARPVLPKQPVYGGNNWYHAYGNSSYQEILDDSKLMASLASASPHHPFMVIDDGWQLCHSKNGNGGPWLPNRDFEDMQKLATEMKRTGVRPGIWFRPLLTSEKVPSDWTFATGRLAMSGDGLVLDPSLGEVREYIGTSIKRLVDWGFELLKHDFSTFDIFGLWGFQMGAKLTEHQWAFADRSKTSAEIIVQFYRCIAESAGNALVMGCNTVGHLAAGVFALQRTGDDTSGREWERTRKMGVNTLAFRMPQHTTFFAVDADCVGLTRDVPWELNRQWLQLLAESGTPLFVSAAADAVGIEQEKALRMAFEQAAQVHAPAQPLDVLETTSPRRWLINGRTVEFDWYGTGGVQLSV